MAAGGGVPEWIVLTAPGGAPGDAVTEEERTADSIRLTETIPGIWRERRATVPAAARGASGEDAGDYDLLSAPGHTHLFDEGRPCLPAKSYLLEIPEGVTPEVEFRPLRTVRLEDVRIRPAQPFPADVVPMPPAAPFARDEAVYGGTAPYPAEAVVSVEEVRIRDRRLLRVVVAPARFHPADSSVEVHPEYDVRVFWDAADARAPDPVEATGLPIYLILAPDIYATNAALEALADWKARKGLDVRLVKTSQIDPGGAPSHAQLVAYLRGLPAADYPDYLLVVGPHTAANGVAGAYFNTSDTNYYGYTDLDLACRTTNDFFPDLCHGRLPAVSQAEVTAMAGKALAMDRTPPEGTMYHKVCVAGQIQDSDDHDDVADRLFCETADSVARYFEAQTGGGPFACVRAVVNPDGMTATGKWNASSVLWNGTEAIGSRIFTQFVSVATAQARINAAVNGGVAVLQHRDHGYVNGVGWADPQYLYTHVNALTNGDQQPVVFSINCNSGMYNFPNNFARAWLSRSEAGAYAVLAPVDTSYSWLNDWLVHGFYAGFRGDYLSGHNASVEPDWPKNLPAPGGAYGTAGSAWRLGAMLNFAKFYMAENFYADESTFRLFHLFGDPEGPLRLMEPQTPTVSHPAAVPLETGAVTVEVNRAEATVCLYGPEAGVHAAAAVEGGQAVIPLAATNSGTVYVTVTGPDLRPYEGELTVFRGGEPFTFTALPLAGSVMLRWSDPRESGRASAQVRVRGATTDYPTGPEAGRAVYAGEGRQHLDESLTNEVTYFYSIWVTDDGEQFVQP